ncbi:MAG: uroporphyrinogen-III synthase [Polyangiaceae bacterium]
MERAVRELGHYQAVAFTSDEAVERLFAVIEASGADARAFAGARLCAVGPGTAAALAARGVRADIVARELRGEGLADAILADPVLRAQPPPRRLLLPRALVAREVLPETLRAAGFEVDVLPVYETRKASLTRRDELMALLERGAIDAVMLTSSSTADNLCDLLGDRAAPLLAGTVVASIGPVTGDSARARGLRVDVEAAEHTMAGLLDALEGWFAGAATGAG